MPYYPNPKDQDEGVPYDTENYWEHVVANYLRCSFFEVLELDLIDYLGFRREAFISRMSETKEGREYLRNAYLYENTKPDKQALMNLGK